MGKTLTELRTTGFKALKPGRIHVRCYDCGRKQSNTARTDYDPPEAVLIETPCEKCGQGCKEPESFYYDANGVEVEECFALSPLCEPCILRKGHAGPHVARRCDGTCDTCDCEMWHDEDSVSEDASDGE